MQLLDPSPLPSPFHYLLPGSSHLIFFRSYRIARNIKYFETWCSYNGLEQVAFSDLSSHYRTDAALVFDLKGKIPEMLIDGVRCKGFV